MNSETHDNVYYDKLYKNGGFKYEAQRATWKAWVEKHYIKAFGIKPGSTILDMPCGDGFWSSVLAEFGMRVTGLDISSGGISEAKRRYPGIHFDVADAEKPVVFAHELLFDVVFSRAITHVHHPKLFRPETITVVKNLMQKVTPDGFLLFSYYTHRDGQGPERHAYHPVSDLVGLFETAGDVRKVDVVGDFVQIATYHRQSGRKKTQRAVREVTQGPIAMPKVDAAFTQPLEVKSKDGELRLLLRSEGIVIPAGCQRTIRLEVEGSVTPTQLLIPPDCAEGMIVINVIVYNRQMETPFMDGQRRWHAELFDGALVDGLPRNVPYGSLPRVKTDPNTPVEIIVENPTLVDRPFALALVVDPK